MRTLHLDSGKEMRGGQWQTLRLVEGLRRARHSATLLAPAGSPLFQEASRREIAVQPLHVWQVGTLSRAADLVHAHDARSHSIAALTARRPLIVSRRVAFPIQRGPASRWKYRRAAHYIAVSQAVKRTIAASGVPETSISVVYDGVPAAETHSGGDLILAPATDDPQKGTALAVQAASRAGVILHLSRNLDGDLARARFLVYISHSEGLGSGVLLAMAAGIPVVASNIGGLPEIVQHERNGLLVDNDVQCIADAIRLLLDNPGLAAKLGACARITVEQNFSVDSMVQNTMRVYERVASS